MSLTDLQHVEVVAILNRLMGEEHGSIIVHDGEARRAAVIWLAENHPEPAVYMAALKAARDAEAIERFTGNA